METKISIKIVGCGPGAPEFVTPAARNACAWADVAVGAPSVFELFMHCPDTRIEMKSDSKLVMNEVEKLPQGTKVVVLVTGDPGVFSLATSFINRFGAGSCEVIPGVSSVQVAFARLGLSWSGAKFISAHHQKPAANDLIDGSVDRIAILAGVNESFGWIAEIVHDFDEGWRAYAMQNLTLPEEKITDVSADELRAGGFSSKTIVLIVKKELLI